MVTLVSPPQRHPVVQQREESPEREAAFPRTWWTHILWLAAAAALGFAISALFAGVLQLPRAVFLVAYVALALPFMYAYVRWSRVDLRRAALHHWPWGVLAGLVAGAFVVNNVLGQPASTAPSGIELIGALVWLGVVYGTVDALLLSVMPMLATWQAFSSLGWTGNWPGRILTGVLAILASIAVTAAYHLGYPEYRNPSLAGPIVGNTVMSLSSLLSMSPIAAVFSHIAMHTAAVLHGIETTVQLPPHYPT